MICVGRSLVQGNALLVPIVDHLLKDFHKHSNPNDLKKCGSHTLGATLLPKVNVRCVFPPNTTAQAAAVGWRNPYDRFAARDGHAWAVQESAIQGHSSIAEADADAFCSGPSCLAY